MLLVSGSDPSFRVAREKAHFSGLKMSPTAWKNVAPPPQWRRPHHHRESVFVQLAASTTDPSTSTATLFSCVTPYWRMDALIVRKNSARFGPRARIQAHGDLHHLVF
jgi:hypothetical protein